MVPNAVIAAASAVSTAWIEMPTRAMRSWPRLALRDAAVSLPSRSGPSPNRRISLAARTSMTSAR